MISHVSAAAKYFIKITADFPEAFSVSYARQAAVNRAEKSRYKKMPIFSGRLFIAAKPDFVKQRQTNNTSLKN